MHPSNHTRRRRRSATPSSPPSSPFTVISDVHSDDSTLTVSSTQSLGSFDAMMDHVKSQEQTSNDGDVFSPLLVRSTHPMLSTENSASVDGWLGQFQFPSVDSESPPSPPSAPRLDTISLPNSTSQSPRQLPNADSHVTLHRGPPTKPKLPLGSYPPTIRSRAKPSSNLNKSAGISFGRPAAIPFDRPLSLTFMDGVKAQAEITLRRATSVDVSSLPTSVDVAPPPRYRLTCLSCVRFY